MSLDDLKSAMKAKSSSGGGGKAGSGMIIPKSNIPVIEGYGAPRSISSGGASYSKTGMTPEERADYMWKQQQDAATQKNLAEQKMKMESAQGPTVQAVKKNIDDLKAMLERSGTYSGKSIGEIPDVFRLKGRAEGVLAEAIPNYNKELRTYNKTKEGFSGLMARTFGGEKGVMTDRDISRFVRFLPDYETTSEERASQWAVIDRMYNNISEAMRIKQKNPNLEVKVNLDNIIKETPQSVENPVIAKLKAKGASKQEIDIVKKQLGVQ